MPQFSQLLPNGSLESATDWFVNNVTISDGVITMTVLTGQNCATSRSINIQDGTQYKVTALVNGDSGKKIRFRDSGGGTGGLTGLSGNGQVVLTGADQEIEFTWTANSVSDRIRIDRQTTTADFTVTIKHLVVSKLSPFNDIIKPDGLPTPIFNDIIRTYAGEEPWHLK